MIRALMGHTIPDVHIEHSQLIDDDLAFAVHGTYLSCWRAIETDGIRRMGRNHIHLARDLPGHRGVVSGMRNDCEVEIWVDVAAAEACGPTFSVLSNGVVLTEGPIPPRYFAAVLERDTGDELLPGVPDRSSTPPGEEAPTLTLEPPQAEELETEVYLTSTTPWRIPSLRRRSGSSTCYRCEHFIYISDQVELEGQEDMLVCQRCRLFRNVLLLLRTAPADSSARRFITDTFSFLFGLLANAITDDYS